MTDSFRLLSYDTRISTDSFWSLILVDVLVILFFLVLLLPKKKTRLFSLLMIVWYVTNILLVTVFLREKMALSDDMNFSFWQDKSVMIVNKGHEIIANILLFIPLGGFLSSVVKRYRLLVVLLIGISISLLIEYLQYSYNKGVADINDVVCNVLGLIVGMSLFFVLSKLKDIRTAHS